MKGKYEDSKTGGSHHWDQHKKDKFSNTQKSNVKLPQAPIRGKHFPQDRGGKK